VPASDPEQPLHRLVKAFVERENAQTARAYREALEDFRAFARRGTAVAAIQWLIDAAVGTAEDRVERYKRTLLGTRDEKGKLVKGRGLSSASVNLRLTVLRGVLKKAHRMRLVGWELPVAGVRDEPLRDVRGPTEETLNRMLEIARSRPGPEGCRDYAILRLAAELGLRRREIIGLDLDDVDLDRCELRILGKGRREKELVSCTARTVEALRVWIQGRPPARQGFPLFTNLIPGRAARISGPAVYLIVRGLGSEALPKRSRQRVSPHRIRHSAITLAVKHAKDAGLAREQVRQFSRHADMRMLGRYIDADDKAQAKLARTVGDRLT
jgi:integrase